MPVQTKSIKPAGKYVKHCEACAIGSLFLAHVLRFNEVKIKNPYQDQFSSFVASSAPLKNYFSAQQLKMIEQAFEGFSPNFNIKIPSCMKFFRDHNGGMNSNNQNQRFAKNRLLAIMENIKKFKGTFKP